MKEWPVNKLIKYKSDVRFGGGWDVKYFMCGGPTGDTYNELSQFYYNGEIKIKFGSSQDWKKIIQKFEIHMSNNMKSGWHNISDYEEADWLGYVDEFYRGIIYYLFTKF